MELTDENIITVLEELLPYIEADGGSLQYVETEDYTSQLQMIKENRRYIQEAIMPSYEIGDNWDNPHHNNWVKAGGWKDK